MDERTARMRGGTIAATLVLAAVALAGPAGAQEGAEDAGVGELLEGSFVLAEPQSVAQQRLDGVIEQTVSEMPFFIRGFGRGRLRDTNPVHERVQVEVEGPTVIVSYGPDRYEAQENVWTDVVARGEPTRLLVQRANGRIYQTFRTGEGEKSMVLTPSEDGSRLWLDVTVTSERLESPMTYRLSYRRE